MPHRSTSPPGPARPRVGSEVLSGVGLVLLAACASYPERTAPALRDFRRGHFEAARSAFGDPDVAPSPFLRGAEAGTVALVAGDWPAAMVSLQQAAAAAADVEGRALAGVEAMGEELASLLLNERARAYSGEGFERVYLHCELAMAYLARGMLEDVLVEVRLANRLLEAEEELYEARYAAGGWGHLLSAVTYEILGEPGEAYVDYLRMEEKGVGTPIAGSSLVRLSRRLRREDDLARWSERYGDGPPLPEAAASVVVLAGLGLGPHKVESRLAVPTPEGLFAMAGVSYRSRPQPVSGLRLRAGALEVETVPVEDVSRVARANLADRQAWLIARSAARGLLKHELTGEMGEEFGPFGYAAGILFAVLTERADLRFWSTLPDSWHAARLHVPPGVHALTLEAVGGDTVDLGRFELEPGETMLVFARTLGTRLHAHPIGGGPVEALVGGEP